MIVNRQQITLAIGIPLIGILAVVSNWYLANYGFSYWEAIILLLLVAGIFILSRQQTSIWVGFLVWLLTLGLGYRTVQLTRALSIHPAEILLWGLLGLVLLQRGNHQPRKESLWLPRWLWLFLPFWIWGWFMGAALERPWDRMLAELKNFLILIPLFLVAEVVLAEKRHWRTAMLWFFLTGAWIAAIGLLEYLVPGVARLFPGFVSHPLASIAADGFARASFSFWGTPAAAFVLVLTLPTGVALWMPNLKLWQRIAILAAGVLQAAGIYISGYRSMWLLLALELFIWAVYHFGLWRGGLASAPFALVYLYLPSTTQERLQSLFAVLEGRPIDSSGEKRWVRLLDTLQLALDHPGGIGWAGSGWTHSDFAQLAANLGIVAGILFLAAYLIALVHLWQHLRSTPSNVSLSLFLAFVAVGWLLTTQAVQVLPQLFLPVLLIWVLVELHLHRAVHMRGKT